ncbi:hypothetical protein B0T11DRAFT_53375 [Plectosphaerella cucumerina]|uniref:Uncharacterized protein n=1 Tax=Plectosphaerella cucumerina TaxID=40658 RepID=A0A8K0TQE1_9PEZI|nr:hypothetical protein B0T11DRAFT_53375 [Plectosphaerella cucumerina]
MSSEGEKPRRRFVPEPIETTYESVRRPVQAQPGGYMPELTPEASPRELSPTAKDRVPDFPHEHQAYAGRRFAPQLIETSRRVRRVGDTGPATKPADKTDITPYTNHIYVQRSKSRRKPAEHANSSIQPKGARRESEDENAGNYVLEWAAKEAERQMQEDALAAFPNSRAREGGAAHFYFRESSGDDTTSRSTSPAAGGQVPKQHGRQPRVIRRKSSDLDYWHKHMQEHAVKAAADRGETIHDLEPEKPLDEDVEMDDDELDKMELETPPDPLWTTARKASRASQPSKGPIGESYMPLITSTSSSNTAKEARLADIAASQPARRPIGESHMPLIPPVTAPASRMPGMPLASSAQIPPETGFRNIGSPFGRPFGGAAGAAAREDINNWKLKKAASPPMLGKDLVFRRCPSPKLTKLEPDQSLKEVEMLDETYRDHSGQGGLWRGYCYRTSTNEDDIVPATLHGPRMLATPFPPSTPGDPFAAAFGRGSVTDEPETPHLSPSVAEHRVRSGEAKGLHMLSGIDEKLRREKANAEREEKITAEFDDAFITQVYNYLSLGYPATARAFDGELSKISRISVENLEKDDEKQMASGHITEAEGVDVPIDQRCPRWIALKKYIREWARQHPDLDSLEPFAWGMRERRGSWAI